MNATLPHVPASPAATVLPFLPLRWRRVLGMRSLVRRLHREGRLQDLLRLARANKYADAYEGLASIRDVL